MPASRVNHIGTCVGDLVRAADFYRDVFGFVEHNRLEIPDGVAAKLLRVPEPVGLTAVYLTLGDTVLELLHFDRPGNDPQRDRSLTEPGLTHISLTVDDLEATCAKVVEYGGEVLEDTNMGGFAVFVRDPDGQLLELLPPGALDAMTS